MLRLCPVVLVGCDERSLFFLIGELLIVILFHCIKKVDYFLRGLLNDSNQVGLFEPSIYDNLRYSLSELSIFGAGF